MSKKPGSLFKKHIIIIAIVGLTLLIGGAAVVYYFQVQKPQHDTQAAQQKKAVSNERTKLDETAFRGNKDTAAAYGERVSAGDTSGAVKIYENAAASVGNAEKIALYRSAITAARQAKQDEQVLLFSQKLAALQPDYRIYVAIADLYAARHDSAKQVEYLQKAVDAIEGMPHDSQVYQTISPIYQAKLKEARA